MCGSLNEDIYECMHVPTVGLCSGPGTEGFQDIEVRDGDEQDQRDAGQARRRGCLALPMKFRGALVGDVGGCQDVLLVKPRCLAPGAGATGPQTPYVCIYTLMITYL